MKTLEDVVDIKALKRQGFSERQIAKKLGVCRQTVSKYLNNPEAVSKKIEIQRTSKLDPFEENIKVWLKEDSEYRATWIYDHLVPLGFTGCYDIVKRRVRDIKEESGRIAYMRFETLPGVQAQVDFAEFSVDMADGTVRKYYVFSMILGYSRKIYAELIEHCDMPVFLDCHIRAFNHFGGIPGEVLYDRMRNVYIGKFSGKTKFNSTLTGFAVHYGYKPLVAPSYAAWVKGKIERPYDFIREGFWRGYGFISLETANRDLWAWLKVKEERIHGTTHEKISIRFERERPCLNPLPLITFDTSYRIFRKVHKDCTVMFEGNSYVVPHKLVGAHVLLRVKDKTMRIFSDDKLVVVYEIPEGRGHLVQDKRFYQSLRKDNEMNARKYSRGFRIKGRAKDTLSPSKPKYDMDVQVRPVFIYDQIAGGLQ
jgi:transposase